MLSRDLPLELIHKEKGNKYSEKQREFAVTLQFYSRKAYDYVSKFLPLPNVRTIGWWLSTPYLFEMQKGLNIP